MQIGNTQFLLQLHLTKYLEGPPSNLTYCIIILKMLFNFTKVNNSYNIKRLFHKTPFFATRNWRWWPVCFLNFFNHIWQRCDYRFMKKKQWSIILSIASSLKNFVRVNILRYIPSTHVSIPEKDFIQRRIQKPIKHLR